MTPLDFLRQPPADRAVLTGDAYDKGPIRVESGDTVGVVLMEMGGPLEPSEVERFVESRLLDPVSVSLRVPRWLRPRVARWKASRLAGELRRAFELIGGSSPMRRHVSEQAKALERLLGERYGAASGATFRTYVAMRHGEPSMATARRRMAEDGVTKLVLLPLQPQYSTSTAGTSLAYWHAHGPTEAPVALVREYAAHPKLVRALSERIDEGLQRFPREARDGVHVLFAAHGASRRDLDRLGDPYCCHVHATAQAVLAARGDDRPARVAFQDVLGTGPTVGSRVRDAVADAADDGATALLVVPLSFLSERVDTAYDLDVTARAVAEGEGISRFEVTTGLNCHSLVIETLAECVASEMVLATSGDGLPGAPAPRLSLARAASLRPTACCPVCERSVSIRRWPELDPVPAEPAHRSAA